MKLDNYAWGEQLRDLRAQTGLDISAILEQKLAEDLVKTIDREIVKNMFALVGGSIIEIWWSDWQTKPSKL